MAHVQAAALHGPNGGTVRLPGATLQLAPGVRCLPTSPPIARDHIKLWLLRDEQQGIPGWAIVDCSVSAA